MLYLLSKLFILILFIAISIPVAAVEPVEKNERMDYSKDRLKDDRSPVGQEQRVDYARLTEQRYRPGGAARTRREQKLEKETVRKGREKVQPPPKAISPGELRKQRKNREDKERFHLFGY